MLHHSNPQDRTVLSGDEVRVYFNSSVIVNLCCQCGDRIWARHRNTPLGEPTRASPERSAQARPTQDVAAQSRGERVPNGLK